MSKVSRGSKESTPIPIAAATTSSPSTPTPPPASVSPIEDDKKRKPETPAAPEKNKLIKEDSNESETSIESEKKIIKKEKGPAPPPPPPAPVMPPTPLPQEFDTTDRKSPETAEPKLNKKDLAPAPPPSSIPPVRKSPEITEHGISPPKTPDSDITVEFKPFVRSDSNEERSTPTPPATVSVTSTPNKPNTSTITINSDNLQDPSNSLATNSSVNQVTVVTSHPPIIVDNSVTISADTSNEVVIVSNETNKTHINESSTDDDYPSLDSLESSPRFLSGSGQGTIVIADSTPSKHSQNARKLDESEVLIVNSSFVEEEDSALFTGSENDSKLLLDTSHVSVVTVGEEIKVKDSSNQKNQKINGELKKMESSREDVSIIVNKKKTKPEKRISPDSSVGSMDSRTQSECGSVRSTGPSVLPKQLDRSDAESIATTASHDSREQEEEVIVRRKNERSKEEIQLRNLRKKTRKRTRKFEIDGVPVTTTTSKVIYGDDENGRSYDDHIVRKQELREVKMLQKQEKKQFDDLQLKEQVAREQQERRFDQERNSLERTYDADMDTLARQHKTLTEKTEQQQETDLRAASKRIRADQERELKLVSSKLIFHLLFVLTISDFQFRDNLKQELRLLKQEIDLLPKDRRKDEFRKRKLHMEADHEEKESIFLSTLSENHEIALRRLSEKHRDRLATIDKNFLQQKQTVSSNTSGL